MQIRTDMALELADNAGEIRGVTNEIFVNQQGMEISRIHVETYEAAARLGKPVGNYITIDMGNIASLLPEKRRTLAMTCGEELGRLIENKESVLVVGLGNRMVTPDSLGPKACEGVFVTRHIKAHIPDAIDERAATVSAISPGVLGVTGIESEEVIDSLCARLKPDAVIAVDALAAREVRRIGSSIQICDTGIQPGAGLGNRRRMINRESMGVEVVAIGVPTVAYASTLAADQLSEAAEDIFEEDTLSEIMERIMKPADDLVVTPTDIDKLTDHAAAVIAEAINIAVNPHIPYEDIRDFMD